MGSQEAERKEKEREVRRAEALAAKRYPMEDLELLAELQAKAAEGGWAKAAEGGARQAFLAWQELNNALPFTVLGSLVAPLGYPMEDLELLAELQTKVTD